MECSAWCVLIPLLQTAVPTLTAPKTYTLTLHYTGLERLFKDPTWRPGMIVLEADTGFLKKIVGAAGRGAVDTLTLLQRFLPLGYRVWTGDLEEEITGSLQPGSGKAQASAEALDAAGKMRGCGLYVLHFGQPPGGEWHTGLGCLEH